jgi:hypothetical protein
LVDIGLNLDSNLAAMLENDDIRDRVLVRLGNAGWITGSVFATLPSGMQQQEVNWTEAGIIGVRKLHCILSELGYFSGASCPPRRNGEIDALAELVGLCILKHGGENPQAPETFRRH